MESAGSVEFQNNSNESGRILQNLGWLLVVWVLQLIASRPCGWLALVGSRRSLAEVSWKSRGDRCSSFPSVVKKGPSIRTLNGRSEARWDQCRRILKLNYCWWGRHGKAHAIYIPIGFVGRLYLRWAWWNPQESFGICRICRIPE